MTHICDGTNDIDELSELILLEGLTLEQAKKHILKRMEKERLEHLNNLILTKLGVQKIMKPYKLRLSIFQINILKWALKEMLTSSKLRKEDAETYREIKELINRIEQL